MASQTRRDSRTVTRTGSRPVAHRDGGPRDILRQIAVISAVSFALISAMVGTGLFGGASAQEVQGGALDADGSFLAPARSAFSIWRVIYLGLISYTVWQALPSQRASSRHRAVGWPVAATAVLNGAWLVASQYASLFVTVLVMIALLAVLGVTFWRTVSTKTPRSPWLDAVLIDGVTGLHLGWVAVALVANVTAWLTQIGSPSWARHADAWGIAVLIVVLVIGLAICALSHWRVSPALAMAWGCMWIGVARLTGEPASQPIATTAFVVAALLFVGPMIARIISVLRASGD